MPVKVITDSAADLPIEIQEKYDVTVLRMKVIFGEEEFIDEVNLSKEEFYQKLKETVELPKSSQVTPIQFEEEFRRILAEGNEPLVITMSSSMSGTYQSAMIAKEIVDDERIQVIDSMQVTFVEGLVVFYAARMAASSCSMQEIVEQINSTKERYVLRGIVDTLTYLKKGGRLSPAKATIGSLLNIKPVIAITKGELEVPMKFRGMKKALTGIIEELKEKNLDLSKQTMFIGHADAPKEAEELRRLVEEVFEVGEIFMAPMGPLVGTHSGPGCVGFAFIDDRK
ncbi:MAG: fatty acid-binding protein DegV [Clostridiales bacterium]|jgi:DegV family protein with EDD domain|nr:fatty acid-binding protein DegV [Clostridiales bacterium]